MNISEAVCKHLRFIGFADDAPKLSDLVKLFLEENLKDKSIIAFAPTDRLLVGHDDTDVVELKLNGILVAWVLNTKAIVRLRMLTASGVVDETVYRECDVPAADPELFEKLWAHIAYLDEKVNCPGWSILEKHPDGKTVEEIQSGGYSFWRYPRTTTESAYPAFNDDAN